MNLWPADLIPQPGGAFASGFIVELSDHSHKQVVWVTGAPINPPLGAAKEYAAALIQSLVNEGKYLDVRDTNWASATAAIVAIVVRFNEQLAERLHASRDLQGSEQVAARGLH